jgi:hypothetical protein
MDDLFLVERTKESFSKGLRCMAARDFEERNRVLILNITSSVKNPGGIAEEKQLCLKKYGPIFSEWRN